MTDSATIHEEVQKRYGSIASSYIPLEQASIGCCGSSSDASCGCNNGLYNPADIADLPNSVTDLSLGCGDPVSIASLKAGDTVLDMGSGAGIDVFFAAKQVGTAGRVIGVDMTPQMLEKANANKAKLNAENVEFREGYIEKLPVEDNSVDVILSNCVINLSPDKAAVFHEAFRVLKPGGRVSISDIVTEGEISEQFRAMMDLWAGCITGAIDVTEYTSLMGAAGLVDIRVEDKAEYTEGLRRLTPNAPRVYSARITARKPN